MVVSPQRGRRGSGGSLGQPNGLFLPFLPSQVLDASGMPVDDDQLARLTAKIGYKKDGMSYLDFAAGFEGS